VLVTSLDQLRSLLAPILDGRVTLAAFDTETTEVRDGRFTAFGTDVRMAGACLSYDLGDARVDFYVPVRHRAYPWARPPELIAADAKHEGPKWLAALVEAEGVRLPAEGGGFREGMDPNLPLAEVLELLRAAFAAPACRWVMHNAPFDCRVLLADGVTPPWPRLEDTKALSVFVDERPLDAWDEEKDNGAGKKPGGWVNGGHSLKHLAETYLGMPAAEEAELEQAKAALGIGSSKFQDYSALPLRTVVARYGWGDTRRTLDLYVHLLAREMARDEATMDLYRKHVREFRISVGMEALGIGVDVDAVPAAVEKVRAERDAALARAQEIAGRTLHPDSPLELADELYDHLGFPVAHQRDTRKATLKKVRARLAGGTDRMAQGSALTDTQGVLLIDAVLEYRRLQKLLVAFYEPLLGFTSDGRVHCVLDPLAARTTRYSAAAPNMQQAPKPKKGKTPEETERHRMDSPRRLFKPSDGHSFLFHDFSQIELRLAAHYANAVPDAFEYLFSWRCTLKRRGDCKGRGAHGEGVVHYGYRANYAQRPERLGLFEGFWNDPSYDPHEIMSVRAGVDRDRGKTANFAILYGAGINKLAETLDCSWEEAKRLMDVFWREAYPELDHVKQFIGERLRRGGKQLRWSGERCIRTLHGAPIFLDGAHKGLNYLIQRSAREILLNAILSVSEYLEREAPEYRLVLPVHDELIVEAPTDSIDRTVVHNVCRLMVEAGAASTVPMVVEPEVAHRDWAHKEELPEDWGCNGVELAKEAA
jgi:DNA polymerase I-like protein with 3'-5' exonuclease and polymerase domains